MRVKSFHRTLRLISAGVLFFFVWTFGSVWEAVAYAATSTGQGSGSRSLQAGQGLGSGAKGQANQGPGNAGDRFEKALESIREKVNRIDEKTSKNIDATAEIADVHKQKAEIDSLDVELRKEFAATEKKLMDVRLPKEILNRHYKFVKHYEDNLNELKTNLDAIDKPFSKSQDLRAAFAKAKAHLEKTKTPSKHVPLDPNKLPHRMVKAKAKAPRLKKEEFEKDFPVQKKQKANFTAEIAEKRLASWYGLHERTAKLKPILVASSGSLDGLVSSSDQLPLPTGVNHPLPSAGEDRGEVAVPNLETLSATSYEPSDMLLAQATVDLPTASDFSETPEVQFTPEIQALAAQLNHNPVKIYEWVRNNIDYQPYYGSFKGASQALAESAGNDFDQASLLIALLRASNIAAKYAYGTVEIQAEKASNMVGVSDPKAAATIYSTQGIPVKLIVVGGTVKAIQMERVWVEVWIDYSPSRGSVHKQGDIWIPLDPSFKQYMYKQGMDMYALMGFSAEEFLQSYITDTRNITAYQDYSTRMIDFLDTNYPNAEVEDVFGASEIQQTNAITKKEFPFLLGTLPYKIIIKAAQFDEIPATNDYTVSIQIEGDLMAMTSGLSYAGNLNYLADNRITFSYDPATSADDALVAQYGGNIYSVPPYLINVKPVLRVNGAIVASGDAIGLGKDQNIIISFAGPDGDTDRIQNITTAGAYSAIILQPQDTPVNTPSRNMVKLIENSKNADLPDVTLDDLLGQILYSIGVSYFETLSYENEVFAKTMQLLSLRQPSEAMVTQTVKVDYIFGLPQTISVGGVNIDVDRNVNTVYSPSQDNEREKAFMILSGLASSVSENRILEAFFSIPAVSSIRLLKLASERGIPIYTITKTNLNDILPLLQTGEDVKNDIVNAVNAGKNVIVPKANISYGNWAGVGYIISDPITGAGSYMISGGLGGGDTDQTPIADPNFKVTWMDRLLFKIVRSSIITYAEDLIGTLYKMGCKDPSVTGQCRNRIDCSGLTARCYIKAGLDRLLGNGSYDFPYKNAQQQYDYSLQIDAPIYGDLVFFKGSYDKNCDGLKDTDDGVTHVAIYRSPNIMIGSQGKGVKWYEISSWGAMYPKYCEQFVCKTKINNVCVEWDTCQCAVSWQNDTNRPLFDPFVGYGKILP